MECAPLVPLRTTSAALATSLLHGIILRFNIATDRLRQCSDQWNPSAAASTFCAFMVMANR